MRLNQDAVRDILLFVESNLEFNKFFNLKDFYEAETLKKYDNDTIKYTLLKLSETDYLHSNPLISNNDLRDFSTGMLTWEGHEFLDTVRDKEVWSKTKAVSSKLESVSIGMLSRIGTGVINHIIDKTMGF
ncbi:DUF2513 domain-containing protein [Leuconostoc mesenteroides]|uniref:DUF2513 domain-containing protein n=1 Tax=Leuconostoc mesenteroides TaxID=1245 RepID=UPI0013626D4D|nr:DUF2513 domain-containing protein [Leuconostoc mesenteroides]QHM55684.1 hypothetical protein C7M43_00386 [Leuconostoc mesenteroides]